jgi:hypothetical protein
MLVKPKMVNKAGGEQTEKENYFGSEQEQAVRLFLSASTIDEKNKIYNEYLKHPLDKMISSIIRRYKLYRKDMNYEEIHNDTHSFLMTKIDKFKPAKEKKAYSYFGTICKNYLMGQIMKDQKETNRKVSYEDISTDIQNNPHLIYFIDNEEVSTEEIIKKFKVKLYENMNDKKITEQEQKLGRAISDLFENYKNMLPESNNNKFNKNVILFELREMTNLSTKEIRTCMKRYKKIYVDLIQEIFKD